MSWKSTVKFGRTAEDYRRHRAGFPDAFFERIATFGVGAPGQRLLDLGTGTGTLARGFALRGASVTGLDPSDDMLAEARALDAEAGVSVDYVTATAEATGLQDAAFDVVTAGQCWHWFDGPRAAAECRRVLAPGGSLVVAHFDYLALPDNPAGLTEELLLERHPGWSMAGSDGFYDRWLPHLESAGFADLERTTWTEDVVYSQEAWRGRIRACNGVLALGTKERIAEFDEALRAALEERYGEAPLTLPHRVFVWRAKA